ncbi:MAG: aminoglycoside phosphotransferase family protein [Deltaproteobacteria bacterium]|nr:aminoglycoside phosphotransferase family protein [Deltaproteobacteria bacterium]
MSDAPAAVLARYGLEGASVTPILTGLIHRTYRVEGARGARFALQQVSPIFARGVQQDIARVTAHLAAKGVTTPELVHTSDGALDVEHDGQIWRLLTWIDGETIERVSDPGDARVAASLLGRFHASLADLQHRFVARRLGVHDTVKHLSALRAGLDAHAGHRLLPEVRAIAHEIFDRTAVLPDLSACPERVVHGDPKISNVIFVPGRRAARAMVDLDTVGPMQLPLELGDALRSWCNPLGEDASDVRFDVDVFAAAIAGYAGAARGFISPGEIALLVPITGLIMLELSARFALDALNERYFGWNAERFRTRGDHNLLRARGQLALARDFATHQSTAERVVVSTFHP